MSPYLSSHRSVRWMEIKKLISGNDIYPLSNGQIAWRPCQRVLNPQMTANTTGGIRYLRLQFLPSDKKYIKVIEYGIPRDEDTDTDIMQDDAHDDAAVQKYKEYIVSANWHGKVLEKVFRLSPEEISEYKRNTKRDNPRIKMPEQFLEEDSLKASRKKDSPPSASTNLRGPIAFPFTCMPRSDERTKIPDSFFQFDISKTQKIKRREWAEFIIQECAKANYSMERLVNLKVYMSGRVQFCTKMSNYLNLHSRMFNVLCDYYSAKDDDKKNIMDNRDTYQPKPLSDSILKDAMSNLVEHFLHAIEQKKMQSRLIFFHRESVFAPLDRYMLDATLSVHSRDNFLKEMRMIMTGEEDAFRVIPSANSKSSLRGGNDLILNHVKYYLAWKNLIILCEYSLADNNDSKSFGEWRITWSGSSSQYVYKCANSHVVNILADILVSSGLNHLEMDELNERLRKMNDRLMKSFRALSKKDESVDDSEDESKRGTDEVPGSISKKVYNLVKQHWDDKEQCLESIEGLDNRKVNELRRMALKVDEFKKSSLLVEWEPNWDNLLPKSGSEVERIETVDLPKKGARGSDSSGKKKGKGGSDSSQKKKTSTSSKKKTSSSSKKKTSSSSKKKRKRDTKSAKKQNRKKRKTHK